MPQAVIKICELKKEFGRVRAVNSLDLEIHEGEFFTLLGPSGCGKTTTLRMVGGLEKPDGGAIYLGEQCLVSVEENLFVQPEKRNMGMVFQSYALWPHMTVFQNVAYPLKLRRIGKAEIRQRVMETLSHVGLEGLQSRPIPALSGGQQQRVALARALVFSPRVLLLDEPLSNLDAQLRGEMRHELKSLQRRVGTTVLFVTHDQIEALSLSDRLGIMNRGRLEQVGSPEQVYYRPETGFARDFLGKTFSLPGKISAIEGDRVEVKLDEVSGTPVRITRDNIVGGNAVGLTVGHELLMTVRPEQMVLWSSEPEEKFNVLHGTVTNVQFLGDTREYTVCFGSKTQIVNLSDSVRLENGQRIFLEIKAHTIIGWLGDTVQRISDVDKS